MKIGIMYGGKSGEHEVSIRSATSVVRNIDIKKHEVYLFAITQNGAWFMQHNEEVLRIHSDADSLLPIETDERLRAVIIPGGGCKHAFQVNAKSIALDVVFPVLHGSYGEDGTIQGLFEMADIPYVGGGVLSSAVAMDKEKTKQIWQQLGLPVVPYLCVRRYQWNDKTLAHAVCEKSERDFLYPLFVKPCCAGSSVGAAKANNRMELEACVRDAFLWDDKVLIEPFINAREIECSVTGNEIATAYTPGEIKPSHEFYDYKAKYLDPAGAVLCIPAELDDTFLREVREIAVKAYQALDLTGLARVDFFIEKNASAEKVDGEVKIILNEINTIPGFTSISMFAKMCEAAGLPYPQLILTLLQLAIERYNKRHALRTSREQ